MRDRDTALKCDLRDDTNVQQRLRLHGEKPVSYEQGLEVAKRARASRYLECSAKYGRGVNEVFQEAAKVSVKASKQGLTRHSSDPDEQRRLSLFGCLRW